MTDIRRIGAQRDILGESPIWSVDEQALYWVDIRRPALRRLDHATGEVETHAMPGLVGAIAFTATAGRLVVAVAQEIALYDWAQRRLTRLAVLPHAKDGLRFNDGRCDRQGRFWVGTMHNTTRAPEGSLYRLDESGLTEVLSGICIPNSLAWSPDGQTMYFADSPRHEITRHRFDPATGAMAPGSPLVSTSPASVPDGSTVDAEGHVWNAEFNAARVVRYTPDGIIDRVIATPVARPTACAFGGPSLDLLFVTSTSQDMDEAQLAEDPLPGALFVVEAGMRGLAEPCCTVLPSPAARSEQP